jgi:hypothetical protein
MDRVRIVQMLVFEATRRTSVCSRRVSDPLIEVFGENGRHARTAIGDAGPPLNIRPVEIQMICTVV